MYGKIFESIYDGTLYGQWEAIVTFEQMIILADDQGIIDMTPPAIAARTSIPLDIIEKGIKILESEDPYTRTPGNEGRRIELIDDHRPWGWSIVNYSQYRRMASYEDKRKADRERMAKKRENAKNTSKNKDVADSREQSQKVETVAKVAYTDTDTDNTNTVHCTSADEQLDQEFESLFWSKWPYKKNKIPSLRAYKKLTKKKRVEAVKNIQRFWSDKKPDYYILASTYLNNERWNDETSSDMNQEYDHGI